MKHQLVEEPLGPIRCTVCGKTWKNAPQSECPGVMVYGWAKWPEHLLTKKQLSEAGFQTGKQLPPPAGAVYRDKSPGGIMWLYDRAQGVPKKAISDEQRAQLKQVAQKAAEGWNCPRCGQPHGYSTRRGYWRAQYLYPPRPCFRCEARDEAADWARALLQTRFLILDTETTGLHVGIDEIIQIGVLDSSGETRLNTFVQPEKPERMFERDENGICSHDIHGISLEQLATAPTFPALYPQLAALLTGRTVVIYNAAFDKGMLDAACRQYELEPLRFETQCAMTMYAQWYGDWSDYWNDFRFQALNGGHDALADCRACLEKIREVARSKPEEAEVAVTKGSEDEQGH